MPNTRYYTDDGELIADSVECHIEVGLDLYEDEMSESIERGLQLVADYVSIATNGRVETYDAYPAIVEYINPNKEK